MKFHTRQYPFVHTMLGKHGSRCILWLFSLVCCLDSICFKREWTEMFRKESPGVSMFALWRGETELCSQEPFVWGRVPEVEEGKINEPPWSTSDLTFDTIITRLLSWLMSGIQYKWCKSSKARFEGTNWKYLRWKRLSPFGTEEEEKST